MTQLSITVSRDLRVLCAAAADAIRMLDSEVEQPTLAIDRATLAMIRDRLATAVYGATQTDRPLSR